MQTPTMISKFHPLFSYAACYISVMRLFSVALAQHNILSNGQQIPFGLLGFISGASMDDNVAEAPLDFQVQITISRSSTTCSSIP